MSAGSLWGIDGNLWMAILAGLTVVSLSAIIFLMLEMRRLKKPFSAMADLYANIGTEQALRKLLQGVDENREYIRAQSQDIKVLMDKLRGCYNGMGIVKYNAFEDVGGMQSYSLCILNRENN
ncbi:MAG: DUF4446 family protein, partial [Candidatus Krumholzibacteriota bacterium]|nr:DUF4446 family protein [Candidatus Krumholzibacteriota bacterium]